MCEFSSYSQTQFAMDLKEIIAVGRSELLSLYLQKDTLALMKAVAKDKFIRHLSLFPAILYAEVGNFS